jgi:hypothetical protein
MATELPKNEEYTVEGDAAVRAEQEARAAESLAGVPSEIEVETVQTDAELAGETLAALAIDRADGKLKIPQVTAGDLPLFELLCPAVLTQDDYTMRDVLTALYILHCGGDYLIGAWEAVSGIEGCMSGLALAAMSTANFAEWMQARTTAEHARARLNAAVTEFGRRLPACDFHRVMAIIRESVRVGTFGFQMVQSGGKSEKKTAGGLMPSGLATSFARWVLSFLLRRR